MRTAIVHGDRATILAAYLIDELSARGHVVHVAPPPITRSRGLANLRRFGPDVVLLVDVDGQPTVSAFARSLARSCRVSLIAIENGGPLPVSPDWVVVGTEAERVAASSRYGVKRERVYAAGVLAYDEWWDSGLRYDRRASCRLAGLDPDRPFAVFRTGGDDRARLDFGLFDLWRPYSEAHGVQPLIIASRASRGRIKFWRRVAAGARVIAADPIEPQVTCSIVSHAKAVLAFEGAHIVEAVLRERPAYALTITGEGVALVPVRPYLAGDATSSVAPETPFTVGCADAVLTPRHRAEVLETFVRPHGRQRSVAAVIIDFSESVILRPQRGRIDVSGSRSSPALTSSPDTPRRVLSALFRPSPTPPAALSSPQPDDPAAKLARDIAKSRAALENAIRRQAARGSGRKRDRRSDTGGRLG
jgi:hypothetical protein